MTLEEALIFADEGSVSVIANDAMRILAAEVRRQHAEIERLRKAVQAALAYFDHPSLERDQAAVKALRAAISSGDKL